MATAALDLGDRTLIGLQISPDVCVQSACATVTRELVHDAAHAKIVVVHGVIVAHGPRISSSETTPNPRELIVNALLKLLNGYCMACCSWCQLHLHLDGESVAAEFRHSVQGRHQHDKRHVASSVIKPRRLDMTDSANAAVLPLASWQAWQNSQGPPT